MRSIFLLLLLHLSTTLFAQKAHLNTEWFCRKVGSGHWIKATVPGTIHTDLMNNALIPDPFYGDQENKLQWIADNNWEYQTRFNVIENFTTYPNIFLQFEGLDTYAEVYLNNNLIAVTDNMFRTYSIDIKSWLKEKNNTLHILFKSAKRISDSLAHASKVIHPCENNRHYTRKAQYHFGWDWAPRLITCGIWRPVSLFYGMPSKAIDAQYSPVKLIQEKDDIGQSFYFTMKGKPVFMKGANWIPADVFLPRVNKERYRELLTAAKEANFNMLRVWGGGVYEDDAFYDLCDSLGIYIWQDFMFAGAMYPVDQDFLENVKQEAIDNILRLRRHPCIVLWCGNNEIDEAWKNWGWQKQFHISSNDSTKLYQEYKSLFEELLPTIVHEYDPGRQYISTSPLYGWGRKESMTHGDSHYWGMWWGMDSIAIMKEKIPRFMSEYGMQAMPCLETIRQFSSAKDLDTSSAVIKMHQKHPTGFKTLNAYLKMEKIKAYDFTSFISATQALQSRALSTTINAQLHSKGRCMGSLLWQFNDCWPVCSWSIIDYYGRKKKAFETVKNCFRD